MHSDGNISPHGGLEWQDNLLFQIGAQYRSTLRTEPFGVEPMPVGMAGTPAARQSLGEVLEDVITSAAARMSSAGRNKLADWTPPHRTGNTAGR
jgi:hypothetical protein